MPSDENTIEEQRMMELEQAQLADEYSAQEAAKAKPESEHFIGAGEATLMLAFTGAVELTQQVVDWLNLAFGIGTVINIAITAGTGFIFFIWLTGKVAKGAPKKWYKTVYYGAAGGIIPIIPGYLGVMVYLYIEDHKFLKKIGGKTGEIAEKALEKIK